MGLRAPVPHGWLAAVRSGGLSTLRDPDGIGDLLPVLRDDAARRARRASDRAVRRLTWGAPKWPPNPPNVRGAPAEPLPPSTPRRSARPGGPGARLVRARLLGAGPLWARLLSRPPLAQPPRIMARCRRT